MPWSGPPNSSWSPPNPFEPPRRLPCRRLSEPQSSMSNSPGFEPADPIGSLVTMLVSSGQGAIPPGDAPFPKHVCQGMLCLVRVPPNSGPSGPIRRSAPVSRMFWQRRRLSVPPLAWSPLDPQCEPSGFSRRWGIALPVLMPDASAAGHNLHSIQDPFAATSLPTARASYGLERLSSKENPTKRSVLQLLQTLSRDAPARCARGRGRARSRTRRRSRHPQEAPPAPSPSSFARSA